MKTQSSRRNFLAMGGGAAGATFLAAKLPFILATGQAAAASAATGAPYKHLGPDEARILTAVVDQVFPPDEQPGASDLGAVYFIDGAVGGFMSGAWPMIQAGCAELDAASIRSGGVAFAERAFEEQTALLEARVDTPFFSTVHFLTLAGVFAAPSYGGNRDRLGWAMLGFESRHAWQPPFGYYDAQELAGAEHEAG